MMVKLSFKKFMQIQITLNMKKYFLKIEDKI